MNPQSPAQLLAEAERCDRMADLHTEKVTRWLLLRDKHKAAGNHETAAEFGLMALKAEALVQRHMDRALECRVQARRFSDFAELFTGRFKAA